MREDAAYARAIAERDAAVAERDFILGCVQDIGVALGKGSPFRLYATGDGGAEIRALYDSRAEAMAAVIQIGALPAMVPSPAAARGCGAPFIDASPWRGGRQAGR